MDGRIVISTYPDRGSAEDAARRLVKERLAACVNILNIRSFYTWRNRLEEAEEYLAIIKTVEERVEELKKAVEDLHPYEVPEVVEVSMKDVSGRYLEWMKSVTCGSQSRGESEGREGT